MPPSSNSTVSIPRDLLDRLVEGIEKAAVNSTELKAVDDKTDDIITAQNELKAYLIGDPTREGLVEAVRTMQKQLKLLWKVLWVCLVIILGLGGEAIKRQLFPSDRVETRTSENASDGSQSQ